MNVDPASLLNDALTLTEVDRAELAYQLLRSLKPPAVVSADDSAFENELDRRVDAYERGQATAADAADVSRRLREGLTKHSG